MRLSREQRDKAVSLHYKEQKGMIEIAEILNCEVADLYPWLQIEGFMQFIRENTNHE